MTFFLFLFLVIESKTLQGETGEHSFATPGSYVIENTTVEFQKGSEREILKVPGPLRADFIIKVIQEMLVLFLFTQERYTGGPCLNDITMFVCQLLLK